MGRRKIEIKAIKDDRNRSVTFLKRKGGLFKKAHELSVLCSVDVAVIIFGHNKRLYEFSSGEIQDIISRHQYYGPAHEHKGPEDFNGKRDFDDDDDEDVTPPPVGSHSPPTHAPVAPLDNAAAYPHLAHQAPSASPPLANGVPFHPRHGTPQPPSQSQHHSRPSSRTAGRRPSSNLVPQAQMHTSQPGPAQNGYAYMPNGSMYPAQPTAPMSMQGVPAPHGPYHTYPPPMAVPPKAQQAFAAEQRRQSMPPALSHERQGASAERTPPQVPRTIEHPMPPEARRTSTKSRSIFTPVEDNRSMLAQHLGNIPRQSSIGSGAAAPVAPMQPNRNEQVIKAEPLHRPQSAENHVPPRTGPSPPPVRHGQHVAGPGQRGTPLPSIQNATAVTPPPPRPPPPRSSNGPFPVTTAGGPPGAKRPRLKVQIPEDDQSEGEAATGTGSSPRNPGSAVGGVAKVAPMGPGGGGLKGGSGVILPPPSPSASAILSAGAHGPPNPFARPNPPPATTTSNSASTATTTTSGPSNNNTIETPISALPSRFLTDGDLAPSPNSFYGPMWSFGRSSSGPGGPGGGGGIGGDSNILPSPMNLQTPILGGGLGLGGGGGPGGPGFSSYLSSRADDLIGGGGEAPAGASTGKRKTPEAETDLVNGSLATATAAKKVKT